MTSQLLLQDHLVLLQNFNGTKKQDVKSVKDTKSPVPWAGRRRAFGSDGCLKLTAWYSENGSDAESLTPNSAAKQGSRARGSSNKRKIRVNSQGK